MYSSLLSTGKMVEKNENRKNTATKKEVDKDTYVDYRIIRNYYERNEPGPRAGSGIVRIDPLRFLAGCRTRRLNQV